MSSVGKSDSHKSHSSSSSSSSDSKDSKSSSNSKPSSDKPSTGSKPTATASPSAPKTPANAAWSGKSGFDTKPTATSVKPPGTGTPASAGTNLTGTRLLGTNTAMSEPPPPPSSGGFLDTFTQGVIDTATSIGNTVVDTTNTVVDTVVDAAKPVVDTVVDAANTAVDTVVDTANTAVDTAVDTANTVVDTAVDTVKPVVDTAVDTITTVGDTIVDTAVDTAVTVGNVAVGTAVAVGDFAVDTAVAAGDLAVNTATAIGNNIDPPSVEMTPPLPSFTGTAPVQGNSLSDDEKRARGAIEIVEPVSTEDAQKFDGMYIGSDGFAYPPDKFDVSEVPPFAPQSPTANSGETTYFVNGINTLPKGAEDGAQGLANRTGTNVVPIYNATQGQEPDIYQTALDRIDQGENKAADTLTKVITEDLANGEKVNVIGYSQGSAIVARALGDVYEQLPPGQREQQMSNINMVGIAGAGKTFPPGPQYNFYVNKQDFIPNLLGVHPGNPVADVTIGLLTQSSPVLYLLNGGGPGYTAPDATIHVIDDPSDGGILSPHYLETYLEHIPVK